MTDPVLYQTPVPKVARIILNRPDRRNAQDTDLLYALNDAFDMAAQDDDISVIVLAATGPHFSSGHDLRETDPIGALQRHRTVGTWCGFGCAGAEGWMAREEEIYLGFSERWRNIPKPTIAEVQGKVITGGLMLVWPCDLIVAADDAEFQDNATLMGGNGVEYFAHPWELGMRKAKELLFTAEPITAHEAHRIGMVNRVVPRERLTEETMALAERIARQPLFGLKLAKKSVNTAQDAQGRQQAMQTAFALHQLVHSHYMQLHGTLVDPSFMENFNAGRPR
ncbi:enoyl-CoA hydratase [Dactylosporangium sp. AC04546]|uniref:enoyl-CoA hydratase n=1 Tax=Dactylosporangium sp. AC04546 TaxID=2862460 RepID=UPI001EE077E4|nr:enoyl-CoA hydratase [Dactylosporangium sp. AC04546]WVK88779.1 enoyl-CoA hydratase [Dactylosporangium sp. AC04546]